MRLTAHSVSRTAKATLQQPPFSAHVLAVFDQVCDLVTPQGDVVALVPPSIGDGPLSIVVQIEPGELARILPGTPAWLDGDTLQIADLQVALDGAFVWEPCPDWDALRVGLGTIMANLPSLRSIALHHAPADSLLTVRSTASSVILSEAKNLRSGWKGDITCLREGAARLAGRGIGLTPAGDDLLVGLMLWAWLAHPAPEPFCHTLAEVAIPRTTTLSAALLRAAARGECEATWQRLLTALSTNRAGQLAPAVQQVMAHGATSGADMLAGFLCLAVG